MKCPICGVNIPRFIASGVVGFIFIAVSDFVIHGQILADIYAETPDLWRAPEDMNVAWMTTGQVLIAAITAFIFTRNFEDKGPMEGVRFGIMLGCLFAVMMSLSYAWMPISLLLAIYWAASGLMQGLGLGIIYGLLYKK